MENSIKHELAEIREFAIKKLPRVLEIFEEIKLKNELSKKENDPIFEDLKSIFAIRGALERLDFEIKFLH